MNNLLKTALIVIAAAAATQSCKNGKKEVKLSPTEELEKLRAEKVAVQDKIAELEKKVGIIDSGRIMPVQAQSITPREFRTYIDVQGRVDAAQTVLATSEAPGIINAIYVRNGQFVQKGQVLATLKSESLIDDDIDKGIAELDQQIEFAKVLYDKQKRLWEQEIGTEVQLLAAKNTYEALLKRKQTAGVGKKRIAIAKRSFQIVAPISGMVDGLDLKLGQMMAPGMLGIKIVNTSELKIKAQVPENYGSIVTSGDDVMAIFTDLNDTLLTRIGYVSPTIDPVSRAFESEIPLGSNPKYKPNMNVQVRIVGYQNLRAFVLPAAVIQKTGEGSFVYINDGGKAALRQVTPGQNYNGQIEILSGLNLGDLVIMNGYQDLNEGDRLKSE
jgi:membrane fusion protein, multidrug efflux system